MPSQCGNLCRKFLFAFVAWQAVSVRASLSSYAEPYGQTRAIDTMLRGASIDAVRASGTTFVPTLNLAPRSTWLPSLRNKAVCQGKQTLPALDLSHSSSFSRSRLPFNILSRNNEAQSVLAVSMSSAQSHPKRMPPAPRDETTRDYSAATSRSKVLVLNASYEPIAIISACRALSLLWNEKASLVIPRDRTWTSCGGESITIPSVVSLRRYVKCPHRALKGHLCAFQVGSGTDRGDGSGPAQAAAPQPADNSPPRLGRVPVRAISGPALTLKPDMIQREPEPQTYCGGQAENVDHVIPRSKGGLHRWDNVVACCKPCNSKKADKFLKDLDMKLKNPPGDPTNICWVHNAVWKVEPCWRPYVGALLWEDIQSQLPKPKKSRSEKRKAVGNKRKKKTPKSIKHVERGDKAANSAADSVIAAYTNTQ